MHGDNFERIPWFPRISAAREVRLLHDFVTQNTDLLALLSFDLDLPIACDDEYWETGDPATAFKQPPGHPSKIEFFNHYLKLMEIYTATFSAVVCLLRLLSGAIPDASAVLHPEAQNGLRTPYRCTDHGDARLRAQLVDE